MDKIKKYFEGCTGKILFGADGYIDEVWQLIEARVSVGEYTINGTMKRFGQNIIETGTGGMANEIVRKRRCFGGFCANTGNAAARLGLDPVLLGMFGQPADPVFAEPFEKNARLISVGNPAVCHILEFDDGKIMMPFLESIYGISWQFLNEALGNEELQKLLNEADILAVGYWSSMPAFDEIVAGICGALAGAKNKRMFFDFADMKKRDRAALDSTMEHLARHNKKIPMTLSLNEHEACLMYDYYMGGRYGGEPDAQTAAKLRERLELDEIIIHTPHVAAAADSKGSALIPQRFCEKPVKTTGAGDTFNGGFISASLPAKTGALPLEERLAVANAAVSFFIRNGHAPDREELFGELMCKEEAL